MTNEIRERAIDCLRYQNADEVHGVYKRVYIIDRFICLEHYVAEQMKAAYNLLGPIEVLKWEDVRGEARELARKEYQKQYREQHNENRKC